MIKNGQIVSAFFGCSDDYGWILQIAYEFDGFGGVHTIPLSQTDKIIELFKVVGVKDFTELKGKYIRVECDALKQYAIGHIVEDKWIRW